MGAWLATGCSWQRVGRQPPKTIITAMIIPFILVVSFLVVAAKVVQTGQKAKLFLQRKVLKKVNDCLVEPLLSVLLV
jgi:hypothetical protein